MKTYWISFLKMASEKGEQDEYLCGIELDDTGVTHEFTLMAKAFRHAPPKAFMADRVTVRLQQ